MIEAQAKRPLESVWLVSAAQLPSANAAKLYLVWEI
jgi:hypothetical protein